MSLVYNFAGIEGGAGEIQAYVGATNGLLDEGKASLAALADVWGGSGSQAYQEVQTQVGFRVDGTERGAAESRPHH